MHRLTVFILLLLCYNAVSVPAQTTDSSRYVFKPVPFNSKHSDFSPFLSGNKLYFSSGREHNIGIEYFNVETDKELMDIYYAEKKDSFNYKKPVFVSKNINNKYNQGPLCLDGDGQRIFFTSTDIQRSSDVKQKPLSIYVSEKNGKEWGHPVVLSFCQGNYTYCHPTLFNNGNALIFSSNKEGGFGGMDLYITFYENGIWQEPQNMGKAINTDSNEIFPFMSPNENLYFSSNRRGGKGGLDIYGCLLQKLKAGKATRLPPPFNSVDDDFGMWVDSLGNSGYFSSNRNKKNGDDIFYFYNKYPDFNNCIPYKKSLLCYTFFEESTQMADDTLGMTYEWDFGDGAKAKGLEVKHCFKKIGQYQIQLNVIEKNSGELFYNELSYDFVVEEPKEIVMDCPDIMPAEKEFLFSSVKSVIPGYTINKVYWYFGDETFAIAREINHQYAKPGAYYVSMGMLAKNDSSGKTDSFCVSKTIYVKSSTWTAPVTENGYPLSTDGEGAKLNRMPTDSLNYRVHLGTSKNEIPTDARIFTNLHDVKQYKSEEGYVYTSGNAKNITEAIPEYNQAKQNGFKNASVVSYYHDSIVPNPNKSMKGSIADPNFVSFEIEDLKQLHNRDLVFNGEKNPVNNIYRPYLDSLSYVLKKAPKLEVIILYEEKAGLPQQVAKEIGFYFNLNGISPARIDIEPVKFLENISDETERKKIILTSNRMVRILLIQNE